jgi:arginine N-succinyltransferase
MSFPEAERLMQETNKQFIADLMPRAPLYVKLLAPEAQAVLAKPHPLSIPAMKLLMSEGFRFNSYLDVFDGGPTIEAPREQIRTIRESRIFRLEGINREVNSNPFLLSNTKPDFRATQAEVLFIPEEETCILSEKTAELLQVIPGDELRLAPLQTALPPLTSE